MALSKKPMTGMKDIMPDEMKVRNYVKRVIEETYLSYGFSQIETPVVENIQNLTNKQGGENEKLIFKILKRGEKLNLETAETEMDLVDGGLRYDLTVPLVRYYSKNANDLPTPFKALQMGNVFRADRPQRGRYRQFMQCDIDILGDASNLAEIELILATSSTITKLGFKNFEIRINDRRILKAMAEYSGFSPEDFDSVFITLDKMDKIGLDGVKEVLVKDGFDADAVEKYTSLFGEIEGESDPISYLSDKLGDAFSGDVKQWMDEIIESVKNAKTDNYDIVFDPTLVRGMSYYTGTIFEIAIPEFGGSCGGGGRYDKMIGQFTGNDVPACGFSIGFERIILLMMEQGFEIPENDDKVCYLIEKGIDGKQLSDIIEQASKEREAGKQVLVARMNKNKRFQKEQLAEQGYTNFEEFYKE
ncbi:MAG: histidine--tRNA ligase [Eubacterium sp.]|nr:histidine--tRNA ligase [Eubacterium sp.]